MAAFTFILTGDSDESVISAYIPGVGLKTALSSHPSFHDIVTLARDLDEDARAGMFLDQYDYDELAKLFDIEQAIASKFTELSTRLSTADGKLYLDGDEIHGAVVNHVMRSMEAGLKDFQPIVNFIDRVALNPNPGSTEQLYDWLARESFAIDSDGMIVAYKGVAPRSNGGFQSVHAGRAIVNGAVKTGAIPQDVGDVVTMPRSEVTFDPATGCSQGLHVGNFEYANGWARGALLEVRVDPIDVVSVPTDCDAQKMRVCRYTIVGSEVTEKIETPVVGVDVSEAYHGSVWGDFENDEDEDYSW